MIQFGHGIRSHKNSPKLQQFYKMQLWHKLLYGISKPRWYFSCCSLWPALGVLGCAEMWRPHICMCKAQATWEATCWNRLGSFPHTAKTYIKATVNCSSIPHPRKNESSWLWSPNGTDKLPRFCALTDLIRAGSLVGAILITEVLISLCKLSLLSNAGPRLIHGGHVVTQHDGFHGFMDSTTDTFPNFGSWRLGFS